MKNLKLLSYFMMLLLVFGSFAPFAMATVSSQGFAGSNYGSTTNTYQSSRPTFDSFYSGSMDTYWPILTRLEDDQCDAVNSDFVIMIPPMGCSPMVVRSDLLAEQNVPVFCQLSAIRVNPLIDVSTIKSISFKGDYPEEVAGISFHPARAAVNSYRTLLGDPIEENIGYVVIVLKRQPDERNLAEYVSGMLTATVTYDAQGAFGTGSGEYYLEPTSDEVWTGQAEASSFWAGKGYLRVTNVDSNEATIEVLTDKDDVYKTVTLKEGETSSMIYYPGYYCTAALKLRLNAIDNSEDMAKIDIEGDSYWVRKGSRILNGKCVVKSLNVFPNRGGDIEISCSGSSAFRLVLTDKGVVLENKTTKVNVMIGGSIKGTEGNYYLGYYGKNEILKGDDNKNGDFVVLFDSLVTQDEVSRVTGVFKNKKFKDDIELRTALDNKAIFNKKGEFKIISLNEKYNDIKFVSTNAGLSDGKYEEYLISDYLKKAEVSVEQLIENFPAEKKENGEYWGEDALFKQIALAGEVEDTVMQLELIELFLDKYPGSKNTEYIRDLKVKLGMYNYEGSSKNVFVNNDNFNIRVDGFVSGRGDSDSVNIRMGGSSIHNLKRGKIYDGSWNDITGKEKTVIDKVIPRLTVMDIDGKGARFSYVWKDEESKKTDSKNFRIEVGNYLNVGGETFYVSGTQVREVAHVSLIPEVRNTKTEANFTFNIGIEKRAIELSPEAAKKKVRALNKSIAEWEDKIDKLGELVKGLKGACFAVSTVLMFKSMFAGFMNGEAMARGDVMDFYEKRCREEHPGMELQECYNMHFKKNIEDSIDEYGAGVVWVNDKVECGRIEGTVDSGFLGNEVINHDAYVKELKKCAVPIGGWDVVVGKEKIKIGEEQLTDAKDLQAVLLYKKLCSEGIKESDACKMAKDKMEKQLYNNIEAVEAIKSAKEIGASVDEIYIDSTDDVQTVVASVITEDTKTVLNVELEKGDYYRIIQQGGKHYLFILEERTKGILSLDNIYNKDGTPYADSEESKSLAIKYNFQLPSDKSTSCSNTMTTPYVKYHEKYNEQSFVAIVPLRKVDGWYAFVENKDYSDAGIANAFYICNVGTDRKIDDGDTSKDKCQYFQTSSAGSVADFIPCPSLSSSEVKKLYNLAQAKINEANRNKNGVNLDGKFISKTTPYADAVTGMDCTDFMSLDDCSLMFNVCDPVICPPSRCNMGGKFPVSDVIASGIIGSLVLCLHNFGDPAEGKVLIPICLSGVHAGLDAYVSILRSYKDCLEKNIETGEYVGICDEITSIYMCEFFWGQLSPILDTILVRFTEALYGGFQVRGGAEYLTIQKSFDNLDNSINYFTSTYAQGAFRAFTLKNTEEIGSMICKGFVGSSVPTSADLIDSLLEPESPTQFHAYFSEDVFTEATVPSTSHYKVYYHIYAGNDIGTQYKVFLKSPPESSYYANRQTLLVDSGYVDKGTSATEAIDFTAPTGYKELCVNINGQDKCGFGSVSSSFALDYVSQSYINDQADDRQISRTEDCVTTSVSAWGLANPNVQAGVEKSLGGDDIATSGIIRVCASTNPEQGVIGGNVVYCNTGDDVGEGDEKTNPKCGFGNVCVAMDKESDSGTGVCESRTGEEQVRMGRWVDVGYCDVPSMRCWLDSESVKDNLGTYMAVEGITSVNELVRDSKDWEELEEGYKNVREKLAAQREALGELEFDGIDLEEEDDIDTHVEDIITALDEITGIEKGHTGQGSNADKAEALALKASVYMTVVKVLVASNPELRVVGGRVIGVSKDESGDVEKQCEDLCGDYSDEFFVSFTDRECPDLEGMEIDFRDLAFMEDYVCCCYIKKGEWTEFENGESDSEYVNKVDVSEVDVSDDEVGGNNVEKCQIKIGERILEIAGEINVNDIYDETVYRDTGVKSFECLVLQVAMRESSLRHCNDVEDDCLVCNDDGSLTNLRNNPKYDKNAYGVMQINTAVHNTEYISIEDVGNFDNSVKYVIEKVLIQWGYNKYKNGKDFYYIDNNGDVGKIRYEGWNASIRSCNGWPSQPTNDEKIIAYVDKVLGQKEVIEDMFPACKDVEDGEIVIEKTERTPWTLDSALSKVSELISDGKGKTKYSENKVFIDGICNDKVISDEECTEIKKEGFFISEKDLDWLKGLLVFKKGVIVSG